MKSITTYSFYALVFIVGMILVSSCADVTNIEACRTAKPSGFFSGLIHGCMLPFSFIISIFSDKVAIYDVNNTGGWYDFGFLLGAGLLGGGGSKIIKNKK